MGRGAPKLEILIHTTRTSIVSEVLSVAELIFGDDLSSNGKSGYLGMGVEKSYDNDAIKFVVDVNSKVSKVGELVFYVNFTGKWTHILLQQADFNIKHHNKYIKNEYHFGNL